MRRMLVLLAVSVGIAGGALVTTAARSTPSPAAVVEPATTAAPTVTTIATPEAGVLLVWVPGGLPTGFGARVAAEAGLDGSTVVLGDTLQLAASFDADGMPVDTLPDGRTIPLDAIAVDCATWAPLAPIADGALVCGLEPDEALLGATSARLRRIGEGTTIVLDSGRTLRIAGVVADEVVGGAELVLPIAGATDAGVDTERFMLAGYTGDRAEVERRVRAATDVDLRVRGPGETTWLRHGDAVLPQAMIKDVFGEFSARARGDGTLAIDPEWTQASLVTIDFPVLGRATCHRTLVAALTGALAELERAGLLTTVNRGVAGCWNPRTIASTVQPSRHAWGAAVDLIPLPEEPAVVAELVAVMERWGFTWGGRWVDPDPEHFEYVRQP